MKMKRKKKEMKKRVKMWVREAIVICTVAHTHEYFSKLFFMTYFMQLKKSFLIRQNNVKIME